VYEAYVKNNYLVFHQMVSKMHMRQAVRIELLRLGIALLVIPVLFDE